MSIFTRIFKIGQASANKALDKLEKPELMLEQAIRDKEEQIRDAKKAIQGCIATERQTKKMLENEKAEKFGWEQKAQAALKSGKEDLAVRALQRATEHEQKSATLQSNWESQRTAVDDLKKDILKMEDELADFKRNKDFIIAQSKMADVKKNIYEAKARIGRKSSSADDLMARMKAKAEIARLMSGCNSIGRSVRQLSWIPFPLSTTSGSGHPRSIKSSTTTLARSRAASFSSLDAAIPDALLGSISIKNAVI